MPHRPDDTPLSSRILKHLVARGPSKAVEIAKTLGVDRRTVNRALYGRMKGLVVQDSSYRWSAVGRLSGSPPEANKSQEPSTSSDSGCGVVTVACLFAAGAGYGLSRAALYTGGVAIEWFNWLIGHF